MSSRHGLRTRISRGDASFLVVRSNRDCVLVIASGAAGAQLALLGLRNKRFSLRKQFHDAIAALWTLTIRCNHLSAPIVLMT